MYHSSESTSFWALGSINGVEGVDTEECSNLYIFLSAFETDHHGCQWSTIERPWLLLTDDQIAGISFMAKESNNAHGKIDLKGIFTHVHCPRLHANGKLILDFKAVRLASKESELFQIVWSMDRISEVMIYETGTVDKLEASSTKRKLSERRCLWATNDRQSATSETTDLGGPPKGSNESLVWTITSSRAGQPRPNLLVKPLLFQRGFVPEIVIKFQLASFCGVPANLLR